MDTGLSVDGQIRFILTVELISTGSRSSSLEILRQFLYFLSFLASGVEFVRPLDNINITQLPADVLFECELSRPGLTLTWAKDGHDLALSTRCVYQVIGEGDKAYCVHQLKLIKIGPSEAGSYSARLATGQKSEARLSIECPPRINYDDTTDIELIAGKSVVIEVPFSGAPAPEVNWSFNSGPLPIGQIRGSPLASTDTVYGLTCLRLRHVTREATGSYKLLVRIQSLCILPRPPHSISVSFVQHFVSSFRTALSAGHVRIRKPFKYPDLYFLVIRNLDFDE